MNKGLIIVVSSCICLIFIILSAVVGGGGGLYYIKKKQEDELNKHVTDEKVVNEEEDQRKLKTVYCQIIGETDSVMCDNLDTRGKIQINNDKLLKYSDSTEINKVTNKSKKSYYLLLPYIFSVDYLIKLGADQIKINTLTDLYKFFDDATRDSYNIINKIPDRCEHVSLKIRKTPVKPYSTSCIFVNNGFVGVQSIVQTFEKSLMTKIPQNVKDEYYNMVLSKIKSDNVLTLLEYIMYITIHKEKNINKYYDYVTLCNSNNMLTTEC